MLSFDNRTSRGRRSAGIPVATESLGLLLALLTLGAASTLLTALPVTAQAPEVPVLVSTAWVAEHAGDDDVALIHVEMTQMQPSDVFLPGAAVLDYHAIETSEGLAVELPAVEQLVAALEAAGASSDKHIVLYGVGAAHIAARAFFTLEYLGHDRVSVMDGGFQVWSLEGRPTVTEPSSPTPGNLQVDVDVDLLADASWIHERLDDPGVAVIDARPADQYAGRSNRDLREGHIPGAGNLYFVELLESEEMPRLKPRTEVEALFADAGYAPGATVVSYCQIGMRASYNYLIARHLGYEVKLYDGSWQEWGADDALPAETGSGGR